MLKIYVKEINEHEPKFSQEKFQIEISESALPGSSVLVVNAIDQDSNADLTYEIVEPLLTRFKIQRKSGLLTTNQEIDREIESVADLKIKVSDGAHEAFAQVVINVQDVNDQVPKFVKDKYSFKVEENFPLRQSFGKVSHVKYIFPFLDYTIFSVKVQCHIYEHTPGPHLTLFLGPRKIRIMWNSH